MTRNFSIALHTSDTVVELPTDEPQIPNMVMVGSPAPASGGPVKLYWSSAGGGGGGGLPPSNSEGQLLVSGAAPTFNWLPQNSIDNGRF